MSSLFHENRRTERPDGFGVAQVCLNGHHATADYEGQPEFRQDYCDECGAETIHQCPSCGTNIRGYYSGVINVAGYTPPNHCHNCGDPFPWTQAKKEAARALVDLEEELSDEEKEDLKDNLDALAKDTPWTQVAAEKWKRARPRIADGLWKVVISLATEAGKQLMQ